MTTENVNELPIETGTPPVDLAPPVVTPENPPDPGAPNPPELLETFTPNPVVKVYDKEFEIPEKFRALMKDKDSEKEIREIFEKAHGIEIVKSRSQGLKTENQSLKEQIESTDREIGMVNQAISKKDYDSLFDYLGIAKQDVIRYAYETVSRTPEEQAAIDAQRTSERQRVEYDEGYQRIRSENERLATQMRELELMQYMSRPDVSQVAQAYNSGQANPDAFRNFVITIGQSYAAQNKDISVPEAVTKAMEYLKGFSPPQAMLEAGQPQVNPNGVVQRSQKATLPNIQGGNKSPVKQKVNSLDDLKKLARERAEGLSAG